MEEDKFYTFNDIEEIDAHKVLSFGNFTAYDKKILEKHLKNDDFDFRMVLKNIIENKFYLSEFLETLVISNHRKLAEKLLKRYKEKIKKYSIFPLLKLREDYQLPDIEPSNNSDSTNNDFNDKPAQIPSFIINTDTLILIKGNSNNISTNIGTTNVGQDRNNENQESSSIYSVRSFIPNMEENIENSRNIHADNFNQNSNLKIFQNNESVDINRIREISSSTNHSNLIICGQDNEINNSNLNLSSNIIIDRLTKVNASNDEDIRKSTYRNINLVPILDQSINFNEYHQNNFRTNNNQIKSSPNSKSRSNVSMDNAGELVKIKDEKSHELLSSLKVNLRSDDDEDILDNIEEDETNPKSFL